MFKIINYFLIIQIMKISKIFPLYAAKYDIKCLVYLSKSMYETTLKTYNHFYSQYNILCIRLKFNLNFSKMNIYYLD